MNPFDELRHDLVRAAARRSAWRRRWLPHRGLAVALGGLSLAGTATAAIVAFDPGEPSAPVAGSLPQPPKTAPADRTYAITVAPDLRAGAIGWCYAVAFRRQGRVQASGTGCGPAWTAAMHLFGGGESKALNGALDYAVVPPDVASVEFSGGRRVTPRADPSLPYDWRIAVLPRSPRELAGGGSASPRPRPAGGRPQVLDAQGRPLAQSLDPSSQARGGPVRRLSGRAGSDALSKRSRGGDPLCGISGVPAGYRVAESVVATGRGTVPKLRDPAFLSCARTILRRGENRFQVAVLLDAANPERDAAPLPQVEGWSARRTGRAWLVVTGGNLAQRRKLLGTLEIRR